MDIFDRSIPDKTNEFNTTVDVGGVIVTLHIESESSNDLSDKKKRMDLLYKMIQGIASGDDIAMFATILNGPTVDSRLRRDKNGAPPCGCKGK